MVTRSTVPPLLGVQAAPTLWLALSLGPLRLRDQLVRPRRQVQELRREGLGQEMDDVEGPQHAVARPFASTIGMFSTPSAIISLMPRAIVSSVSVTGMPRRSRPRCVVLHVARDDLHQHFTLAHDAAGPVFSRSARSRAVLLHGLKGGADGGVTSDGNGRWQAQGADGVSLEGPSDTLGFVGQGSSVSQVSASNEALPNNSTTTFTISKTASVDSLTMLQTTCRFQP